MGRIVGKLYIQLQVEEMEKELERKLKIII